MGNDTGSGGIYQDVTKITLAGVFCHQCYRHHHYSVLQPKQVSWWGLDRRFALKCISMCCPGLSLKKKERKSFLSLYLRRRLCCSCFSYQVAKDHLHRLYTNYENVSVVAAGIVLVYQVRPISLPRIHSSSLFSGENQHDTFPRVMK